VRLNTAHSLSGVVLGLHSPGRKRPANDCTHESPAATFPRRARSTTPAPLRKPLWKAGNSRSMRLSYQ
jgi:hypothetical protein